MKLAVLALAVAIAPALCAEGQQQSFSCSMMVAYRTYHRATLRVDDYRLLTITQSSATMPETIQRYELKKLPHAIAPRTRANYSCTYRNKVLLVWDTYAQIGFNDFYALQAQ